MAGLGLIKKGGRFTPGTGTGNIFDVSNPATIYYNNGDGAVTDFDEFLIKDAENGGRAQSIWDATGKTGFPTTTDSTQIEGDDFEADVTFDLFIEVRDTDVVHFFVKR